METTTTMSSTNSLKIPAVDREQLLNGDGYTDMQEKDCSFRIQNGYNGVLSLEKEKNVRKLSRNESEKLRRDKLNMHILELAKLVPLITDVNKKIDKSTILRLAVNYLRVHHDLVKSNTRKVQWRPKFLNNGNLGGSLLESLDSFLFVVSQKGTVNYVSENITDILGHTQVDILGHSIHGLIHQEDQDLLADQFKWKDGEDKESTDGHHRSFDLRMLNICSKQQVSRYDTIRVVGRLKQMPRACDNFNFGVTPEMPKFEMCLVAVGKVIIHEAIDVKELAWKDPSYTQWITQHTLDGKIAYSDQRSSWLTGYFSEESMGLSPYDLMHPEDVSSVVKYHGLLLRKGEIPSCVFRMFTKAGEVLYIYSTSHMVVDMWTGKPKSIVSLQVMVKPDEGEKKLQEQREMLAALEADTQQLSISDNSVPDSSDTMTSDVQSVDVSAIHKSVENGRVILDSSGGDVDRVAGAMMEMHSTAQTEKVITSPGSIKETQDAPYLKVRKVMNSVDSGIDGSPDSVRLTDQQSPQQNNAEVSLPDNHSSSTKLAQLLTAPIVETDPPNQKTSSFRQQEATFALSAERQNTAHSEQQQSAPSDISTDGSWSLNIISSVDSPAYSGDDYSPTSSNQDYVFMQAHSSSPEIVQPTCKESLSEQLLQMGKTGQVQHSYQDSSVRGHIKKLMELEVKRQEHEKALEQLQIEYENQVRQLTQLNSSGGVQTASESSSADLGVAGLSPSSSVLSPVYSSDCSSSILSPPTPQQRCPNSSSQEQVHSPPQPSTNCSPEPSLPSPQHTDTCPPTSINDRSPQTQVNARSLDTHINAKSFQTQHKSSAKPTVNSVQPLTVNSSYPLLHNLLSNGIYSGKADSGKKSSSPPPFSVNVVENQIALGKQCSNGFYEPHGGEMVVSSTTMSRSDDSCQSSVSTSSPQQEVEEALSDDELLQSILEERFSDDSDITLHLTNLSKLPPASHLNISTPADLMNIDVGNFDFNL